MPTTGVYKNSRLLVFGVRIYYFSHLYVIYLRKEVIFQGNFFRTTFGFNLTVSSKTSFFKNFPEKLLPLFDILHTGLEVIYTNPKKLTTYYLQYYYC